MARDRKTKVTLKTVDERAKAVVIIRLGPKKEPEDSHPPIRLELLKKIPEVRRVEEAEPKAFRSNQPEIHELPEMSEAPNHDTELAWGEESRIRKPRPWGWLALAALVPICAIAWSLMSVKKADLSAKNIQMQTVEAIDDEASEQRDAEELVDSIESAIRSYFAATSLDSRLRWVRLPDRVAPLMRRHEAAAPPNPSPLQSIRLLQPMPIERFTHFWMASVELASGDRHELLIECTEAGPRIDWEMMVHYQPMSWDEFAESRPEGTSMDFRLRVQPDTFYSHEFSNEQEWTCYRLSSLKAEKVMFGYVRRGTDTEVKIAELTRGIEHASLILRLQIPAGIKSSMGVVIDEIISPRWLLITPPEEN